MVKSISLAIFLAAASSSAMSWSVDIDKDAMTGKENRQATISSKNNHDLKFPYGKVYAQIVARKHARYGMDVIFFASDGQIPCSSFDPCTVLVRFDEGVPQKFSGGNPSDGSRNVVFLKGYDRFVSQAAKASKMIVEVEFWNNGRRQFEFDPKGFPDELLPRKTKK